MDWRLPYAIVFLGLVMLAGVGLRTAAEAVDYPCGNITTTWPIPSPYPSPDVDCDGFANTPSGPPTAALNGEDNLGTHQYVSCSATSLLNDESAAGILDAWPPDFDDNQIVNGQDLLTFATYFGGPATGPAVRWDLKVTTQNVINGQDLLAMSAFFTKNCTTPSPTPPAASISRYLGTIEVCYFGQPNYPCPLRLLGRQAADQHQQNATVILGFGRAYKSNGVYGTKLPGGTGGFVSIDQIEEAAKDFLRGFAENRIAGTNLTLIVGTTNCVNSATLDDNGQPVCPAQSFGSGYSNGGHGQAWRI